jgi:hypothetical protein
VIPDPARAINSQFIQNDEDKYVRIGWPIANDEGAYATEPMRLSKAYALPKPYF